MKSTMTFAALAAAALVAIGYAVARPDEPRGPITAVDRQIEAHAQQTLADGRQTFRYDTFGDQDF